VLGFTLFPWVGVQLPVPDAVSLEEAEGMDSAQSPFIVEVNTHVYCLLSSVILLILLKPGLFTFYIFTSHVLFDTKTGNTFPPVFSKQNRRLHKAFGHSKNTFLWLDWVLSYMTIQGINSLFLSEEDWPHDMESYLESR